MFIELVDVLRCPNPHEDTWLVLAADRLDDRDVMEGTLGCPICHAELRISAGIARFDNGSPRVTASRTPDEDEALRIAALLDLTDRRGYAVLVGESAANAPLLRAVTDVQLLLIDAPADISMGRGLSGLTTSSSAETFPLAAGSARGIALDATATAPLVTSALTILSPGGRLLAPASLDVPAGLTMLARDERHWVAERAAPPSASGIISIDRRR
jgi:uncharacterized protein YbaR (Trm112 family)